MWNVPNASRPLYASMLAFDKKQLAPKPTVALELLSKIRPETNVHRITSWSASFLILGCALSLNAQTSSGTIEGHIVDASKALVGGAHVTLTEQQTAQVRTENADPSGYFEFRAVPIGLYSIQVEAPGFAKEIETGIHLDVAETNRSTCLFGLLRNRKPSLCRATKPCCKLPTRVFRPSSISAGLWIFPSMDETYCN
jgi:hypothetical protein